MNLHKTLILWGMALIFFGNKYSVQLTQAMGTITEEDTHDKEQTAR